METARSPPDHGLSRRYWWIPRRDPTHFARRLADEMRARYLPLPYADASALSTGGSIRRRGVTDRLKWERDGTDWPNRAYSRFVNAGGLYWHVQVMGDGPVLLLIHGTGALHPFVSDTRYAVRITIHGDRSRFARSRLHGRTVIVVRLFTAGRGARTRGVASGAGVAASRGDRSLRWRPRSPSA